MRILISNPDSLGDFVLRQPFIAALAEAGHSLALIVRDFVAPLAEIAVPGIPLFICPGYPYEAAFTLDSDAGAQLLRQVQDFQPDLLVAASYQYTLLEESLALAFPSLPTAAMNGHLYAGDPVEGPPRQPRVPLRTIVDVSPSTHEFRKSELFATALLGRSISLPHPSILPPEPVLRLARTRLAALGIEPGSYWIVVAGDTPATRVRNWGIPNWTALLTAILEQTGLFLIFAGSKAESETIEQIRTGLGPLAGRTVNLASESSGLDSLIGLIHFSAGYLGRDTGPMHFAAALGRPVVAVFGGGTWPRFTPLARTGAAVTVNLPCHPCDWRCHLSTAYCVRSVPVPDVLRCFLRVHTEEAQDFEILEQPASRHLLHQIVQDSSANYTHVVRHFSECLASAAARESSSISSLRNDLSAATQAAADRSAEVSSLQDELNAAAAHIRELASQSATFRSRISELEAASHQVASLQSRIRELEAALARQTSHAETLTRLLPALRSEIEELSFSVNPTPPLPPLWQQLLRRLGRAS